MQSLSSLLIDLVDFRVANVGVDSDTGMRPFFARRLPESTRIVFKQPRSRRKESGRMKLTAILTGIVAIDPLQHNALL